MSRISRKISVAPMMEWTDRHERYFLRLITTRALLYTEMVTTGAIIHGDRQHLLGYNPQEHPLALQIGGSDPADLVESTLIAEGFGYDEINLNLGCPSDRVQAGRFGASLMAEPDLVAKCIVAMRAATDLPVTVKCRLGIDQQDPHVTLLPFIERLADAGCGTFILHARKAMLEGLSPKENRDVPPLDYELVYKIKYLRPELEIIINGGIETLDEAEDHLAHVDGVMFGRAAYHNPWGLAEVDQRFYGAEPMTRSRAEIVHAMIPYMETHLKNGGALHHITRHMLGLFQACPGARAWRRHLTEGAHLPGAGIAVVLDALAQVPQDIQLASVA